MPPSFGGVAGLFPVEEARERAGVVQHLLLPERREVEDGALLGGIRAGIAGVAPGPDEVYPRRSEEAVRRCVRVFRQEVELLQHGPRFLPVAAERLRERRIHHLEELGAAGCILDDVLELDFVPGGDQPSVEASLRLRVARIRLSAHGPDAHDTVFVGDDDVFPGLFAGGRAIPTPAVRLGRSEEAVHFLQIVRIRALEDLDVVNVDDAMLRSSRVLFSL